MISAGAYSGRMYTGPDSFDPPDRDRAVATLAYCCECGYNLHGLPETARCPECGCFYRIDSRHALARRPLFGWLGLLIPAFVVNAALVAGAPHLFSGGCFLVLLGFASGIVLLFQIASRIARWRYALATRRSNRRLELSESAYLAILMSILIAVQLAICVVSFIICAAILGHFGLIADPGWG